MQPRRRPLSVGLVSAGLLAAVSAGAAAKPSGGNPTTAAAPAAVPPTVATAAPLDGVPAGILALAWSADGTSAASDAVLTAIPGEVITARTSPAGAFLTGLTRTLSSPRGAMSLASWPQSAPNPGAPDAAPLAETSRQRLASHRTAALAILTDSAAAATPPAAGQPAAAPSSQPKVCLEVLALVNELRYVAPEGADAGPEGRVLRILGLANARSFYMAAERRATGSGPDVVRLGLAWSSRSDAPTSVRAIGIGEKTFAATDWPNGITPGPWVLSYRPNAYYGQLGLGLGHYLRTAVSLVTSVDSAYPKFAPRPQDAEAIPGLSRGVDRTLFVTPIDGVVTLVLPYPDSARADAALAAAASLLGIPADKPSVPTAAGKVTLKRLGTRAIGLQLHGQ
jgi:hypothetical protein